MYKIVAKQVLNPTVVRMEIQACLMWQRKPRPVSL